MSTAFNLTAQLNLRGPTNVRNIVSGIRRQLGNITADVNLRIDPAATRNLTQLNTALTNFNATLRTTQTNAANTANALRGLANAINGINANNLPRNMTNIATASNRAAQATGRVTQQVGEARNQMEEFGRQSALAVRRFAAFSISAGIIVGFTNAINKGVRAFVEFDKELVKLQQVTGESAKGLSGLQKTIANLASGLGVSSSELINVSSTLAQAGLSARDTEKALKALALSSLAPSFDDMNKTVEGSIALMRQFGISAGQLDQALGSVNAVAAKFAVEASDIIAAIQRTGGVFAAASKGVSEGTDALNEFIAVFTSIRATTRESAETIATGLRTIFTRVQRGETIEALKQYGVNLTDLEGKFVGAYKAVELLSRGLGQIDPRDLRFSQIVEELGGFRQIGKVIPLIQQFATAQQALAVAQRGQGSLAEDAAIAQLSLANQIAKVREEFLTLIRDIGGTDTFQTIAKSALGLASALIKVADSVKGVLPVLGVVMAIRGTAALSSYARGFAGGMGNMRGGRRAASGGYIKYAAGGQVPVALMPGEAVIYPEAAKRIGTPTLRRMNYADKKMAKGGKVGMVPGTGNSDSFYTSLPAGSFVIRKKATQAMGAGRINDIASGRQKFAVGGEAKWRDVEAQMRGGRGRPSKNTTTVGEAVDKVSSKEYNNRKGRFKSDFPFIIRGLNRAGTKAQINEEAILDKYLKKGVNDLSKAIVNQTQGNITVPSSDIDIQNKESIYGGLFETALLKISKRSADKKDNSQNFDFPRGIGPILSNIFSGMPPSISTDVKRTAAANAGMKSNIANKLANEMASNRLPKQPMPVGVVSLSPMDSAIVSKISGAEVNKLLNTKLKQKSKSQRRAIGGLIQKFAKGGLATRNVGYIDSDEITQLLKDSVKGPLIKAEMDRLGIKGVTEYKEHLANLAATRRNDGSLKRLTNIFGVAGSGKSTMLQGGSRAAEADNARLRKTNRYPVLTEQDILRSDQIVDSTSVAGPTQRTALSSADRVIALSSRTKESQEALKKNRKSRDTSGRNLFGRRPGSTKSAPLDSGMGEAYIAASGVSGVDPKKVVTMKLGEKFRKTRTSQPTVRTPDKTGLFYGNFGPTTKGHTSVVKEAEKMGIPAKDFVALVGGDTPIDYTDKDPHSRRTAIFPQKSSDQLPSRLGMARAAFGAMGANVSAMPKGSGPGSIPSAFKVGEDSYIVPRGKGDIAFVGDEKESGSLSKYEKLGYGVKSLPRSGGISGTKAREAIAANDIPALKKLLSPAGFEYVQKHMATLQQRPKLLDAILSKIERNSASGKGTAGRLSQIKSQLADLPSRVSKTTPADVVAKIESLRKERDSLSSKVGRLPSKLMSRLEQRQKFAVGDEVKKRKIKKINPNDYSQSIQNLQNDPNSILRQQAVGVAILQGPKKGVADSAVSKKSIIQSVGKQYSDLLGSAVSGGSIGIQREALKPQVYKDFNEGIENGLVQAVNTAVGTISSKYPELPTPAINGEEERRKYLKGVNDAAKGNMFEEMLTSMRNKGQYDANPDPQRSFDFAPNKGSAFGLSNIFDKISSLLYVDAKASNPSDAAISKKIANQTLRDLGVIKGRKSKDVPDQGSMERDISKRLQSVTEDSPLSLQDLQKELPNAKLKMTNSIAKSMGLVVDRAGGKTNFIRPRVGQPRRLARGGFANRLAVSDHDMTGAVTAGKETPSLSQFKDPKLAVPDIMSGSPTKLIGLLKQYGATQILTARSGGPKGEMRDALKRFYNKNGLLIPDSRITTLGDQINDIPTPERKARALFDLVKKYGKVDFFDDDPRNIEAAKDVKGVNARRVKVRKASGGSIPSSIDNSLSLNRSAKDKRLDSKKLAAFLGAKTTTSTKQQELAERLKDLGVSAPSKPNYEELLKGLKGYAKGGEVPIVAQEGEYVINRKSAKAIGYGNLHALNKYHTGGIVQKFGAGGPLDSAMASMSAKDAAKLKVSISKNAKAFDQLEKGVKGWPIDAVQAAMKKLARTLERGDKTFKFDNKNYNKNNPATRQNKKERVGLKGKPAGTGTSKASTNEANFEANKVKMIADLQKYEKAQYDKERKKGKTAQEARESSKAAAIARTKQIAQPMSKQQERAVTAQAIRKARASGANNQDAKRSGQNALNNARAKQQAQSQGAAIFNTASVTGDKTSLRNALGGYNPASAARAGGGTRTGGGGGTGAGGGGSSRRRRSSGGGQQPDRDNNGRIMGMGRLTQAGFGISMMGGLGSQFFNPESSASNAANAAFTESFTSTIGMGATVAGSIGDLLSGSGEDNNRRRPSRNSRNRGTSTRTRPQASPSSRGNSRSSGPRVSSGSSGSGDGSGSGMGVLGGLGAVLGVVAVGGLALAEGLKAAHNAAREFTINLANNKLQESLEKANKSVEKFSNNLKDRTAETQAKRDTLDVVKATDALDAASSKPEAGLFNLGDAMSGDKGSFERSQILNKRGISAYLSTTNMFGGENAAKNQAAQFSTLIPQLASEKSKRYTGAAESSTSFLESKFRSGSSIDEMKKDKDQFSNLTKSLALADAAIQQQIMTVENSTTLNDAQKATLKNSIIATNAETKAREIQTKVLREMALESLNKTTIILQNSLERMFQNMEQAIASNAYALDKLTASADLASASLSGSAKVGSVKLDSINTLQNPRANSGQPMRSAADQAASMFGNEAPAIKSILQVASSMEDAVMSTINSTLKNNPGATNELVGGSIDKSIFKVLTDLKLPPDLSSKLSSEVGLAIKDMRKSGEDKVDFSQLVEKIPQLGRVLDSAKRAQEVAIKSLENWQNALNEYANTTNQLIDIQIDSNQKLRRATDILIGGQNELANAFGKSASLQSAVNNSKAKTASQTGGPTDPSDIRRNIQSLELTRQSEQARSDTASQKGFGGKDEFMMMQERLKNTSVALRENYDALKNMADNTDVASAALNKISEIRQQRQAGVGFAEKLVSSTPKELANLNMSMARLQNNMAGGMNMSNASQRAGDLQLFNELAPLLGDKQSEMKANVLENMLKESGVGVSPMMQEVLTSLRNPEADPAMQEAIATYREAIGLQAEANKQLVFLNTQMAENSADIAANKLAQSMRGVILKFESQQLLDINNNIKNLIAVVEAKGGLAPGAAPAAGKARGGMIYAAAGQLVDFQPKGTDTVPAMLTPGEFVVNRKSTQKHLPLLKSINSNSYSNGGKVGYYAYGGLVFGDPWQREDKADALNRSASVENETPDRHPDLLKNMSKSKGDLSKYFEDIFSVQGAFYAANKNSGPVSDWFFDKFTGSFSGLQPQAVLGSSYSKFVASVGPGVVDYTNITRSGNVRTPKIGNIPTLEFFSDIVSQTAEQKKIKESQIKEYYGVLDNILKFMPKTEISGDSIKVDGKNIIIDSLLDPKSRPDLSPQVDVTSTADGYKQLITVSNLSKKTGNLHGLYTKNNINTIHANSDDMGGIGNIYGINAQNRDLSGYPYTRIVAGLDSMRYAGLGGFSSMDIAGDLASQTTNYDNSMFDGDMAQIKQRLSNAQIVKANLERTKELLSGGNVKLQESETSEANRNYVNKLQQLLSGSVFKATFSEAEIKGKDSVKPPITLYNLDGNDWDSRVDVLDKDASVTKGTYAGKKGSSWIPVGSRTMGVGTVPDQFSIQKWFPWVGSGFNSTIFDDLKNKYNAQNPNNVKVTPGSYADDIMAFNYKNIEGPMFDANKKMTKNKYKFTTVSLDQNTVNEKLNPFRDLVDQNLLPQDPEKSEIYANTPGDLIGMIKNLVNNTILRTQQNTLSFGSSIKRLSAADKAIADLDFAQQTKDNAYLLNSIAPGFQYEAKLYGDELRKRIAQQKQDQQAAAGEKGIANKANLQDLPENPLLLAEQARGIVSKVLSPVSGILSAYNIKLSPIRVASQIAPYGNYLLQAQQFFGDAVTQKFKNNKKGIDQRLWNVWGALGASGKVFEKLGAGDKQGLQTLLGSAASTLDSTDLGDMVVRYGQLLAAQGATFAGTAGLSTPKDVLKKEIGDNDKQTIEGIFKKAQTEEATVARDGRLTVNKTEGRNLPTNLLDLGKKIVNPYSTFQPGDRSPLFDILLKGLETHDNKGVKRNVNEKLVTNLKALKQFYASFLDPIVSGGVAPNDDMIRQISDQYPTMNAILQVLTNGEYGAMPDAKKMQELAAAKKARMEAEKKASGGIVYASTGTLVDYKPRGTDTVPAMLTPGEFVVNRQSTSKHLPLLRAINSNRYQTGGVVSPNYYEAGALASGAAKTVGAIAGMVGIKLDTKKLETDITSAFDSGSQQLKSQLQGIFGLKSEDRNALISFGTSMVRLVSQLAQVSIPPEIKFSMQPVQVNITGAQGLTEAAQSLIDGAIKKAFDDFLSINDLQGTYKAPDEN